MLIREFVNMLFSVTVFNNVSCQVYSIFYERKFVLVKFEYEWLAFAAIKFASISRSLVLILVVVIFVLKYLY